MNQTNETNETTKEISKLIELAQSAEGARDTESALRLYARCVELDESSAIVSSSRVHQQAWALYAWLTRSQGDAGQALALGKRALGRWPRCEILHEVVGCCYRDLERFEEAEAAYRRAIAIEPGAVNLSFLAEVLRLQGRDSESLECLYAVLELDPNYEEAHYLIGCNRRRGGDCAAAIEHFRRALEIDPEYAQAYAELGIALVIEAKHLSGKARDDHHRLALVQLNRSIDLDPGYFWSRVYLGNLLWQLDRIRQAHVQYETAVRLRPRDGFALALSADFMSSAFGPNERAQQRFEAAIELSSNDEFVRYWYGKHLLRAKRYGEARRELTLAARLGHSQALLLLETVPDD